MVLNKDSRILISACLLGVKCSYKAEASADYQRRPDFWASVCAGCIVFPVCPEQLGGLATPRVPAELTGPFSGVAAGYSRVVNRLGEDVSACFLKGAAETLRLAELLKVDFAVLKSRSPSCGKNTVYDGTFSGVLVPGSGVAAGMLQDAGIKVFDEEEFFKEFRGTFSGG